MELQNAAENFQPLWSGYVLGPAYQHQVKMSSLRIEKKFTL